MVKGLGTVIYRVAWYSTAFQQSPYFDQPFYVGFNIAGYELGLDPDAAGEAGTLAGSGQGPSTGSGQGPGGGVAYWRVAEIDAAVRHFVAAGASLVSASRDVGEGIKVATVSDPFGNRIGLIENPHFQLPAA